MRSTYLLLFILLTCVGQLWSQPEGDAGETIAIGKSYKINSSILEEERPLLIHLPKGYAKAEKQYPVMYLLDGGSNFHHTTGSVDFLSRQGRMPEMIVVGIPNTGDRTHNLTPPTATRKDDFPTAGGADSMLLFITEEVMPFVATNYRVNNYKMLVGHSFGGLFVTHTLLHHPGVFNSYISISPSLWWDEQDLVLNQSDTFFAEQENLKGHLYMTMGNEGGDMVGGAWKLSALLEEKGPAGLKWHFNRMEEETHGTIPFRSTYQGLEFIFADFDMNKRAEDFSSGRLTLAGYEASLKEQFDLSPDWEVKSLLRIGERLFNNVSPAKAQPFAQKATELKPGNAKGWLLLGATQQSTDEAAAITSYQKVLSINPKNQSAKIALRELGVELDDGMERYDVSAKELEDFVGSYKVNLDFTLKLELAEGKLWILAPETAKEALVPLEKDVFFLTSKEAKAMFTRTKGAVTGVNIATPGGTFTGEKVE
ncbi:MAG: alpha/beta hydrolase-fold protein [Bacteroidota bacterium]